MQNTHAFISYLLVITLIFSLSFTHASENTVWRFETGGRIYGSPVIVDNLVLIGSADKQFYAVNKQTGNKVWSFKTKGAIQSSPVINNNSVFFGSGDGCLYALDIKSGALLWKFDSKGEKMLDMWDYYLSSPAVLGDKVFWGSGDGNLYAINAQTGDLNWAFDSGAIIHATPVIYDEKVYFGNYKGYFYALDAKTGQISWQFRTIGDAYFPEGEIQKGAAIKDGVVFVGSRDYNIYALNAKTGRGIWNMKEKGSWVIATPLVLNNNIYFGTSDTHRFYCLNKTNGNIEWEIPLPMRVFGSAVAHQDVVYFGCFDGKLYGVDHLSGKIVFEYQTKGSLQNNDVVYNNEGKFRANFELYGQNYIESERIIHTLGSVLSTPSIDNDIIYFGSSDHGLYAVRLN